ncbi:MAG: methyltransferase domain-containing protein [candidate division KSB1 bacterium]|nr:methyltransferase domain-containing protein [candidate division KSB1 bacterium]
MGQLQEGATRMIEATRRHYDAHHFIEGGNARVRWWRTFLAGFLSDQEVRGALIADVGSSVGEISRGLIDRGGRLVCLDISLESLRRCRELNPEAVVVHGNALNLPFADESFDHVISIGVLHHTPDCRLGFRQVVRVTAPGGSIVVFLYNKWNPYYLAYKAFAPVRAHIPLTSVPNWMVRLMQPLVKLHFGRGLDDQELRNLVGDAFWTPRATFHSVREVRGWGGEEGLTFVGSKRFFMGYAHVYHFRKPGQALPAGRREVQFQCLTCQAAPMVQHHGAIRCPKCGESYPIEQGIVRVLN